MLLPQKPIRYISFIVMKMGWYALEQSGHTAINRNSKKPTSGRQNDFDSGWLFYSSTKGGSQNREPTSTYHRYRDNIGIVGCTNIDWCEVSLLNRFTIILKSVAKNKHNSRIITIFAYDYNLICQGHHRRWPECRRLRLAQHRPWVPHLAPQPEGTCPAAVQKE